MQGMQKLPRRRRAPDAARAVLTAGSVMLAALLGMSVGTALLPPTAQTQDALLVAGGLLVLFGSELWLAHVLRAAVPEQPPRAAQQGRRER